MGKRGNGASDPPRKERPDETSSAGRAEDRRIDQLAEIVDHCIGAKSIADSLDQKLLGYLLAMAIQETRAAMRDEVTASAKQSAESVAAGPRRRVPTKRLPRSESDQP